MLAIPFFALMVAIKGGLLGLAFENPPRGLYVSSILSGLFMSVYFGWLVGLLFAIAWLIGWVMSIGEEIGAIGRFKENWGDHVRTYGSQEARSLGWKKGLQRGVFLGACLSLAMYSKTHNEIIKIGCSLFPLIYFLGNELYYRIYKKDSWFISEFLFGATIGAFLTPLF
jgi:hypothetical protein